jgi:hypothetical protein
VRAFLLAALALLVLFAAGCGSESPAGPAGAEVAPASAELFLSVRTDPDSEEWLQAVEVLERFPDSDEVVRFLLEELGLGDFDPQADLEPALGPETDIVVFDLAGEGEAVGLTQPDDPQKLEEVLAALSGDMVTREIDGWTAFSDSEANLERFEGERSEGTLADSERYGETMDDVDTDALVQVYLNSEGLDVSLPGGQATLGLSVGAEDEGVRLEGATDLGAGELAPETFAAELPGIVPGGVLAYFGTSNLEASLSAMRDSFAEAMPEFDRDLARVEAEIGVSLEEDLFPLFRGETALYVRPGLFIPEVTLVTEVEDEAAALATMGDLVNALEEYLEIPQGAREVEIAGVQATEVPVSPPISLFYSAFDGRLVVTTSAGGIEALRGDEDRLADDSDFTDALDQADVPDETSGLAYVRLSEAIPYVLSLAAQAGDEVPALVRANLEPLDSLVLYGSQDGETIRFTGLLAVD